MKINEFAKTGLRVKVHMVKDGRSVPVMLVRSPITVEEKFKWVEMLPEYNERLQKLNALVADVQSNEVPPNEYMSVLKEDLWFYFSEENTQTIEDFYSMSDDDAFILLDAVLDDVKKKTAMVNLLLFSQKDKKETGEGV